MDPNMGKRGDRAIAVRAWEPRWVRMRIWVWAGAAGFVAAACAWGAACSPNANKPGTGNSGSDPDAADDSAISCSPPPVEGTWVSEPVAGAVRVYGKVVAGGQQAPHVADLGDGVLRELDGALQGANVTLRSSDGTILSLAKTGCGGMYILPAPPSQKILIQVDPVTASDGGYTGFLLARETTDIDLDNYDMGMEAVSDLSDRLAAIGETYDATLGWVIQSLSSSSSLGGEGVVVSGAPSDAYFAITDTQTIQTNSLPPACADGTQGVTPGDPLLGPDGGVICYTNLLQMIFVANVDPGTVTQIGLQNPTNIVCKQRIDLASWVIQPNTVTRVFADCGP